MRKKPRLTTIIASFWRRAERQDGGCWTWVGPMKGNGYGLFRFEKRNVLAHRLAWQFANRRPIPEGMYVCHRCDNPPCVNPAHLRLGTAADNAADMVARGRSTAGRSGRAKMTWEQVTEARRLYAAGGITQRELAEGIGVDHSTLACAIRGDTWKRPARGNGGGNGTEKADAPSAGTPEPSDGTTDDD